MSRPLCQTKNERDDDAERGRLGRGRDAEVQAAHHDAEHDSGGTRFTSSAQALGERQLRFLACTVLPLEARART